MYMYACVYGGYVHIHVPCVYGGYVHVHVCLCVWGVRTCTCMPVCMGGTYMYACVYVGGGYFYLIVVVMAVTAMRLL